MRVWTSATFRAFDAIAMAPHSRGFGPDLDGAAAAPDTQGQGEEQVGGNDGAAIARVLARAAEDRAACEFERIAPTARPGAMLATIDRLTARGWEIERPRYRPGHRALAEGETLLARISLPEGSYVGRVNVLARAPGRGGYLLSRPSVLLLHDRRHGERLSIAYSERPTVEVLHSPSHRALLQGILLDLGVGGLRLRTTGPARVRPGDRVIVRARVDEATRVHALGTVVHAGGDGDAPEVGIRFLDEVPEVGALIRRLGTSELSRGRGS